MGKRGNKCPAAEASQHSYITSSSKHLAMIWAGREKERKYLTGWLSVHRRRRRGITLQDRPLNLMPRAAKQSKMDCFDSVHLYPCLHFVNNNTVFLYYIIYYLLHLSYLWSKNIVCVSLLLKCKSFSFLLLPQDGLAVLYCQQLISSELRGPQVQLLYQLTSMYIAFSCF